MPNADKQSRGSILPPK